MVTLKPQGTGRYFLAAFMLLWLCGWAVGEGMALWLLGNGAAALMTGTPLGNGRTALQIGPALAMGGFLLLWLALWTVGGIAAMAQLLRLTWSEDRLTSEGGMLAVESKLGPFRFHKEFPRDTIRRITLTGRRNALGMETAKGMVELSCLGTSEEREDAARMLRSELGVQERGLESEGESLPQGWEETVTPEGSRVVAPASGMRGIQARVAGTAALGLGALAVVVCREAFQKPAILPFAILMVLGDLALGCGALWLARGRMEWVAEGGRLLQRRRFGSSVKDVFEGRRLELVLSRDSDGDDWFALEAASDSPETATTPEAAMLSRGKNRKRITATSGDPTVARRLGAYLARKANVPFVDRTTREAREAELKVIQGMLEKSGPLGRLAVRLTVDARKRNRM